MKAYYYYTPMTYQVGPTDMLAGCHIRQAHSATRGSLLPQATWDGAQLRTSRCTPHHKVHAPPATHGVTFHQRHCQLLGLVRLPREGGTLRALLGGVDSQHVQQHIALALELPNRRGEDNGYNQTPSP